MVSWLIAGLIACSSSDGDGDGSNGADENGNGTGVFFGGDGADGGGSIVGSRPIGEDCVAEVAGAELIPLDLYIMFDQSGSMSIPEGEGSRLDAVRAATADFLKDPESAGIGVGIGYFGNMPLGETSCDPADYRDPDVGIGELPEHADAILASLNAIEPIGETPTDAAIRGACDYTAEWRKANPGKATAILLLTDGVPEAPLSSRDGGCDPTLDAAIEAAAACSEGEGIPIYVLGVGPSLQNLDQIAAAGGTEEAQIVEGGDVAQQVLEALNSIRASAQIPCEFRIPDPPEGEQLDFNMVNMSFVDRTGDHEDLFFVGSRSECSDDGGWYYDRAPDDDPTTILLCDRTCDTVTTRSAGAQLTISLGCETLRPR